MDGTTRQFKRDNESSTSTPNSNSESEQNPVDTWAANVGNKSKYYNPDPLVRFIGRTNESSVIINGKEQTALIDSGAQVTTITADLVQKLKLPVYGLHTLINFQGMGEVRFLIMDMWKLRWKSLELPHSKKMYA